MTSGSRGAVFLLTDYGSADEFAGVTRAVVVRHAPGAPVVDLTHAIPPFDVRAGALALSRSVGYLGPGVVVAVVDPGVGSERRAVAVSVSEDHGPRYLVGPDNGLLGGAMDVLGGPVAAVVLPARTGTFDGRDLFAPVAARLWLGASLHDVGMPVDPATLARLAPPRLEVEAGSIVAEVLWVDRFGNVQLAARADDWARAGLGEVVVINVGGDTGTTGTTGTPGTPGTTRTSGTGRRVGSFSELEDDEVGLLVDANGQLSLVCDRRPAATVLAVRTGDTVRLSSTAA
ncbi:MAG TPA: SAM-dependent chlorinase/fluorinase [Acidimicrobiales bacterium]|nr:SAM-dependent chlorinase/fluorinase [Acidimicrobiales bacterium]